MCEKVTMSLFKKYCLGSKSRKHNKIKVGVHRSSDRCGCIHEHCGPCWRHSNETRISAVLFKDLFFEIGPHVSCACFSLCIAKDGFDLNSLPSSLRSCNCRCAPSSHWLCGAGSWTKSIVPARRAFCLPHCTPIFCLMKFNCEFVNF